MKSSAIKILFISFLSTYTLFSQAQEDIYKKIEPVYIVETINDSIDIASNFYSFYDSLAVFFEGKLYTTFDNEAIHYPKADFSKKTDTTTIFLTDTSKKRFYVHPCSGEEVTSRFGLRRYRYHYGTDVNLETGDSLLNIFDGIVRITKWSRSYGYVVVVRHLNGLESLYAHLSRINVANDQFVKAGDLIGLGGNTGRSRGSHLHFEIRYLGTPINPEDIINFKKRKLISSTLNLTAYHFRYQKEIAKLKRARFHRIRRGESLGTIARKYRTTVRALRRLNGIRGSLIRAGKKLRVR